MIKALSIQASICAVTGQRIDTLILEYPRSVHAQLLTHRVFSKNSSSTRAIPLTKAIDQVQDNPALPIWTLNQAGMQGEVITDPELLRKIKVQDTRARNDAISHSLKLANLGVHKQNAGRYLEPFQNIRIVLTSTEWANWDWLRDHEDAQGEIAELARAISKARAEAEPMVIQAGEWHVPFVTRRRVHEELRYYIPHKDSEIHVDQLDVDDAMLVSMSVCAQTSYRNADYSLEKAMDMRGKLLDSDHVHASPSEHQATPIKEFKPERQDEGDTNANHKPDSWEKGITHIDRKGNFWSGNFKGFIQHRQLIKGHDHAITLAETEASVSALETEIDSIASDEPAVVDEHKAETKVVGAGELVLEKAEPVKKKAPVKRKTAAKK